MIDACTAEHRKAQGFEEEVGFLGGVTHMAVSGREGCRILGARQ